MPAEYLPFPWEDEAALFDRSIREAEDVGASIVTRHIKAHGLPIDHRKIKIADNEFLAIVEGIRYIARIRCDDLSPHEAWFEWREYPL
jgi:hypothetical protein